MFDSTLRYALSLKRPHGSRNVRRLRSFLASNLGGGFIDAYGNLWFRRGESKTLFSAHLDTVHREGGPNPLVIQGNVWKSTGILGADDGAGVAILSGMIHAGIPGTYVFTLGEEVGCLGAKWIAENYDLSEFSRAVAFDRKGTRDICGSQRSENMASREYVTALSQELGMGHSWTSGVYTDNAEWFPTIPEIVNVSCGYSGAHTDKETLDYAYLRDLFASVLCVGWETLPVVGPTPEPIDPWDRWDHFQTSSSSIYSGKSLYADDPAYDSALRIATVCGIQCSDPEFDLILEECYSLLDLQTTTRFI